MSDASIIASGMPPAAPSMAANAPRPAARLPGPALAYDPNAPFANLQDIVAVSGADPAARITGEVEAANGARANLVTTRVAFRLYQSLLRAVA